MRRAHIGSISHGTLRTEDLLDSFAYELEYVRAIDDERSSALVREAYAVTDFDGENASWLVDELQDALNEYAPPYCYFGTHEGDGSDFGFWPSMDAVGELPRVSDPNEVEQHEGEDCVFVNDHGNVTVYGGDGKVLIDFV